MVCIRCRIVVENELKKLELDHTSVQLGEAEVSENITAEQHDHFRVALLKWGLELMVDKKSVLISKIKNIIIELVHYSDSSLTIKLSELLSQKLGHDYTYLANLFSEVQGSTIEKFYIAHKIERVKELLLYDELNLTEISHLMHYSSVSHLSSQFKKVSGFTPFQFRQLKNKKRKMLEDV
jgi:AraC-like DNA-binding protein